MDIKGFLKSVHGLSENSRRAYEQTLWQLNSLIKEKEPTNEEILSFLGRYSASSLHRHKAAIKAYLEYTKPGVVWPFNRRQFAGRRHRIPRYVAPKIVYELIESAEDADDSMFIRTLFTLGCRINELMGIESGDVTEAGVQVLVKGGTYKLKVITADFYEIISKYAAKRKGKLFPRTYTYYYNTLRKLSSAAGHPEITPHMLRHSRAVDLLRKKMPLAFVQQFLGHANINTTAIYLEITGGELGEELEKVEASAMGAA